MEARKLAVRLKYLLDRVFAPVLLILTTPLWLAIAVAIKLDDRGPVFFRQDRIGLGGRRFRIWKFRSMAPDADRFLNRHGGVGGLNRITRVGGVLRRFGLDELPQLINILRGEMSFIGPRPTLCEHWNHYTDEQKNRFAMRPGITGISQVNGRNTLCWSKRIEADLEYIRNYTLWLDLVILLRTVKVVVFREGFVMDRNPEQVDDLRNRDGRVARPEATQS